MKIGRALRHNPEICSAAKLQDEKKPLFIWRARRRDELNFEEADTGYNLWVSGIHRKRA